MSNRNAIAVAPQEPADAALHDAALPPDLACAIAWLQAHLSERVQLAALAQASGTRPRTLEKHFRMHLRTTPLRWVRRMRLTRARRELLHARAETTVTSVALSSGFSELGRFSGQYRKAFGELPSTTLHRALGAAQDDDASRSGEATRQP